MPEIIIKSDQEAVYVIGERAEGLHSGPHYVYHIPTDIFEKVAAFVNLFKDRLDALVQPNPVTKNVRYWEEDLQGKIVQALEILIPNATRGEISNSLSALGY